MRSTRHYLDQRVPAQSTSTMYTSERTSTTKPSSSRKKQTRKESTPQPRSGYPTSSNAYTRKDGSRPLSNKTDYSRMNNPYTNQAPTRPPRSIRSSSRPNVRIVKQLSLRRRQSEKKRSQHTNALVVVKNDGGLLEYWRQKQLPPLPNLGQSYGKRLPIELAMVEDQTLSELHEFLPKPLHIVHKKRTDSIDPSRRRTTQSNVSPAQRRARFFDSTSINMQFDFFPHRQSPLRQEFLPSLNDQVQSTIVQIPVERARTLKPKSRNNKTKVPWGDEKILQAPLYTPGPIRLNRPFEQTLYNPVATMERLSSMVHLPGVGRGQEDLEEASMEEMIDYFESFGFDPASFPLDDFWARNVPDSVHLRNILRRQVMPMNDVPHGIDRPESVMSGLSSRSSCSLPIALIRSPTPPAPPSPKAEPPKIPKTYKTSRMYGMMKEKRSSNPYKPVAQKKGFRRMIMGAGGVL